MEEIEIENIDLEMFNHLDSLESVYFKKYKYCSFVPLVPRCRPLSDGKLINPQIKSFSFPNNVRNFDLSFRCFFSLPTFRETNFKIRNLDNMFSYMLWKCTCIMWQISI